MTDRRLGEEAVSHHWVAMIDRGLGCIFERILERILARTLALGLALALLAACAVPQQSGELGNSVPRQDDFTPNVMATVIAAGLNLIQERYIEPVKAGELAINGLKGLGVLDPSLTANRANGLVSVAVNGQLIAEIPDRELEDEAAWAVHLALTLDQARKVSAPIRKARSEDLFEALFDGVLSGLDVFSRYAGRAEAEGNRDQREGFDGIGINFRLSKGIALVTSVLPQTPAALAGIAPGDRIHAIDTHPVKGLKRSAIAKLLRGPIGSKVSLRLEPAKRPGEERFSPGRSELETVALVRRHIVPETVTAISNNGIVGFQISSFNQETADRLAARLRSERDRLGDRFAGVVIDLRGNPGGLLRQSIRIADIFLSRGPIVSTLGRHRDSLQFYEAGGRDLAAGKPLVILVDGRTASAAEVVAAALQDRGRAVVMGTTSFGKGTVQTVSRLPNNGELTLTWSRLVAPSGYVIHGLGVVPKICLTDNKRLSQARLKEAVFRDYRPGHWREASFDDQAERALIRKSCPPANRNQTDDWQTAIDVIRDQGLYRLALDNPGENPENNPQAAAVPEDF